MIVSNLTLWQLRIADSIDKINRWCGETIALGIVLMAVIQFIIVVMRYVFAIGSIPLQESVWYLHGITFMVAAGYTLLMDGHVRVDVFYREASMRYRAWVNLVGAILLVIPFCVTVFVSSWGLIINSWLVLETSPDFGLPFVYLLKTIIWVFAVLVALQGVSMAIRSWLYLCGCVSEYNVPPNSEKA